MKKMYLATLVLVLALNFVNGCMTIRLTELKLHELAFMFETTFNKSDNNPIQGR